MKEQVIKRRTPIIIPGAEHMTPEELKKAKQNESMRRQMARRRGGLPVAKKTKQELRKISTDEMVELSKDTRNLTLEILKTKLLDLMSDPEQLQKTNLATLATVFGIMYDKTQLMQGLSTQNVAINAKIDVTMKSDEAIQELNKMRAKFNEVNST